MRRRTSSSSGIGPEGWVVTVRIEGDDDEVTISLEQDIAHAEH